MRRLVGGAHGFSTGALVALNRFSAGNGVDPSRRGIVRCLIRVCIPQVLLRIIEAFSASVGLIVLASHPVKYTLSQLEALIGCRIV